jgi:hypothetical protein
MRQKVLKETELPSKEKSKTDSEDPKRARPYTDIAAPTRQKVLKDKDDPKCKKSKTDSAEPILEIP